MLFLYGKIKDDSLPRQGVVFLYFGKNKKD